MRHYSTTEITPEEHVICRHTLVPFWVPPISNFLWFYLCQFSYIQPILLWHPLQVHVNIFSHQFLYFVRHHQWNKINYFFQEFCNRKNNLFYMYTSGKLQNPVKGIPATLFYFLSIFLKDLFLLYHNTWTQTSTSHYRRSPLRTGRVLSNPGLARWHSCTIQAVTTQVAHKGLQPRTSSGTQGSFQRMRKLQKFRYSEERNLQGNGGRIPAKNLASSFWSHASFL